jgi:nucleoside-diphosphate-sugar epimerase
VKVLVTGAGGVLGRQVVSRLTADGHSVRAHDRVEPPQEAAAHAAEVIVGDLRDREHLADALSGVDAVVHAAAHPSPNGPPEAWILANNIEATYNVLDTAGRAGVGRIVNISSLSALGLAWSVHELSPESVPLTEQHPYVGDDVYGLSKYASELITATVSRRWGSAAVSLRFPFLGTGKRLAFHLEHVRADPGRERGSLWGWLDSRDAARAVAAALTRPLEGAIFEDGPFEGHVVLNVAAPDTTCLIPTAELMRRYHPNTRIDAPLDGFATPISTRRCAELLGFTPIHTWRTAEDTP